MTLDPEHIIVITASGSDRPGLLVRLLDTIAGHSIRMTEMRQTVLRDRFMITLMGECSSATSLTDFREALTTLSRDIGFDVQVEELDSVSEMRRKGNVVVIAHGQGDALSKTMARTSEITANIIRVITMNEGNVEIMEFQVDDRGGEFFLVTTATIPDYRLDFRRLKQQLEVEVPSDQSVGILVHREEALRYIYRVDTE